MAKRSVFFYGLFMDPRLLQEAGFHPSAPTLAELQNYALRIGQRATLIPQDGNSIWGVVMALEANELQRLYSQASVKDYQPVAAQCRAGNGKIFPADVYILPADWPLLPPTNTSYIEKLIDIADKMNLPETYQSVLSTMKDAIHDQLST